MVRDPSTPSATWQNESRLARNISWMAASIAIVVALSGPIGYFWLSYQSELKALAIEARLYAAFVTQVASTSEHWRQEAGSLVDANLTDTKMPEARRIDDLNGHTVGRGGSAVDEPTVTGRAEIRDRAGAVGEVVVTRSMRPALLHTLLVMLLSAGTGGAIFATLRLLPLRSLRRTLDALKQEEAHARAEIEERLRIVFEHSIEGIVTLLPDGTLLSCNPAANQIFAAPPEALVGRNLADLIAPACEQDAALPFTVGHSDTLTGQRLNGETFPAEITVSETHFTGTRQMIAIVRDITERKNTQDRLAYMASYDSLTGLPNRILFRDRLGLAMERAKRTGRPLALMFLDLDRFKVVNDSLGHEVGDLLLRHVADTLGRSVRGFDSVARWTEDGSVTVSRLGGDEFTVIVESIGSADDAAAIARRILKALVEPFITGNNEIYISASLGISLYPNDDIDLDGLVRHTDMAMYRSKALGRNTYSFYSDDMNTEVAARLTLEACLRHALERNEFELHYQPKADLCTGAITGVEALLRWRCPDRGMVPPDRFIGALEDTGLIVPVGAWVIRTACAELAAWQRRGLQPLTMAVNLSARQFRDQGLPALIADTLRETGLPAQHLELELTESLLMKDSEVNGPLASFANMGVRVAIDDFGTGHSSLSYLKRFSVDTLKIDRSFVRDTPGDAGDCALATAIVALGHALQLKVVAEGVETPEQATFLRMLGCNEMQGYLLSRPLPAEALVDWLADYAPERGPLRKSATTASPTARVHRTEWAPTAAPSRLGNTELAETFVGGEPAPLLTLAVAL